MSRFNAHGVIVCMDQSLGVALVRRLRAGDTTAFDEIYDAFNRRLFSFLWRMAKNRDVAEDLVEETWLRLVSSAEDLYAETDLAAWLFTVARNLYVSYCRSRTREQSYTADLILLWPGEISQSPFDLASLNEFGARVEAAVVELPARYREVILLVGVEGLRPADAATVCGISPDALRQRLSRARALLVQRLNNDGRPHEAVFKEVSL